MIRRLTAAATGRSRGPDELTTRIARARPSGWMYLVAAAFIAYYVVMVYSERWAPRRVGFEYVFGPQGMEITRVNSHSAADRAGLQPGDRLLAIAGQTVGAGANWARFEDLREIGIPYRIEFERVDRPQTTWLTLGRQPGDSWVRLERKRYVQAFLLLLAFMLAFSRPSDRVALIGAWLLAGVGTAPLFPGSEMVAIWRRLPLPLGAALWLPQLTHFVLLPLFFTFYAMLPRSLLRQRWHWLMAGRRRFSLQVGEFCGSSAKFIIRPKR